MANKKGNIEIGHRAYEEVCRIFGNGNNGAKKMLIRKNIIYEWKAGSVPCGHYLAWLHYYGCDVIYILTGRRNIGNKEKTS